MRTKDNPWRCDFPDFQNEIMKIKTLFTIDGVITSFVDSTMEKIVLWDDDRTTSTIIFGENPLFFSFRADYDLKLFGP